MHGSAPSKVKFGRTLVGKQLVRSPLKGDFAPIHDVAIVGYGQGLSRPLLNHEHRDAMAALT